jgi:hypothetical protein
MDESTETTTMQIVAPQQNTGCNNRFTKEITNQTVHGSIELNRDSKTSTNSRGQEQADELYVKSNP